MDLSQYSLADLKSLLAALPAEIQKREKSEKIRIRKELETLAAQAGFTLDELLNEAQARAPRKVGTVAVKYRHPKNPELHWTGRGRQPKWITEFISAGGSLQQLSV